MIEEKKETEELKPELTMLHLKETSLNINSIEARKERLANQLSSLSPTVDIMSNAMGGNSIVELEKRLQLLQLRYTEYYPEVVRLNSELKNLIDKNRIILN